MGLFHDDVVISTGLLDPVTTFISAAGILILLAFSLLRRRQFPVVSFAILWFFAGHSLESSIFALEIAYEHRNYLPSFGPVFAGACAVIVFTLRMCKHKNNRALTAIPIAIVMVFAWSTWTWANSWKDTTSLATHQVSNHPHSARANNFAAYIAISEKSDVIRAIEFTSKGIHIVPEEAGFRIDMEIFLAYLSSEMTANLSKKQMDISTMKFHFPTLPNYIQARNINGELRLINSESDRKIIAGLLRNKPIAVHSIVALDKLTECIINKVPHCQTLKTDAIEWLETAAENTRTSPGYRAFIAANAAKLHAYSGNYPMALNYISIASQMFPNTLFYRFGKAEYLIRLGRLEQAELILDDIQQMGASYSKDQQTLALLREMLNDPTALENNSLHSRN
jgi:hypothetical protein